MDKKIDVRSRYTQGIIKQAFLGLLEKKQIQLITVSEICNLTQINRGTFYNHFCDILNVYETIEDELFEKVIKKMSVMKADSLSYEFFCDIMRIIADNKILVVSILNNIENNRLFIKIIDFAKMKYLNDFSVINKTIAREEIDAMFTYILNGSIGIISEWIKKNSSEHMDIVANRIHSYNAIIMTDFLKRGMK